ncbi:T9SS type A sorting domain-containing protein [Flavobacterium sp. DG1-102-2]|uniref:T9SS type A sorting domain-containing protein n=1 Tax=Flavobacterium sp. DG1-102-2 TaxID=3081663 RepID=UPI0029497DA4|nr:T9SS type A sorting domain-containing protein [Flavobacterium sp. DG1-102-2]MDV6167212.1 T9SS type A sorting domain-containing protein [Flavobacterium sp. DG1-102-2]
MKKQLLAGAFVLASFFAANAQTALFPISFEASEGYTAGAIHGQNTWQRVGSVGDQAVVSADFASEGTNSLKLQSGSTGSQTLLGAYSPLFDVTPTVYTVNQDFYLPALDANGSDAYVQAFSYDETAGLDITSRVILSYTGDVVIATGTELDEQGNTVLAYDSFGTYTAGEWHTLSVTYNTDASTVSYSLDGTALFTGPFYAGESVNVLGYAFDDYTTSFYFDNINVTESTAGVKDNAITSLTVSPNPANDFVTITNNENALVNGVVVTDLNGRTVKTVKFAGVSEAQVNVSDLASGIYMMTISSDKGATTKKIIKN